MIVKQLNSLEKIRLDDKLEYDEINTSSVLRGERYSYQIAIRGDWALLDISVASPIADCVTLYNVENSVMDYPVYDSSILETDDDYISKEPGLMPDLLVPISEKGNLLKFVSGSSRAIWVRVDIPKGITPGSYDINVILKSRVADGYGNAVGSSAGEGFEVVKTMTLKVLDVLMPEQDLIYSQWLHVDCIADAHETEIYSEEHWRLIEDYISAAADTGMNMLMMPVITPPLDTMPGTARPCVQLVDIKCTNGVYSFDFKKVHRWIALCKKYGIKYYEMSHLFSQWGSEFSPNILIDKDGDVGYHFTWGIKCDSEEYVEFLNAFIPELIKLLDAEDVLDYTYFHVSDEPNAKNYKNYERARNILKPLIGDVKTCDALSDYTFYENGLVDCPITSTNHIESFLEHDVPNQWAYYCCGNLNLVGNRMLSMPSHRNRILGLQMYKYEIKGFLQWGYNFYYSELSAYKTDPYKTTSGDLSFPSGDAFSVYPGKDGALLSLRALVFYEGIQDISACLALEKAIGRDKVIELIEKAAGMELTFKAYPRNSRFLPELRNIIYKKLEENYA